VSKRILSGRRYHLPAQGYVRVQKVSGARGRLIFTRSGEDMLPREMGIKEFKRKAELISA
jgi:hypothetical protein